MWGADRRNGLLMNTGQEKKKKALWSNHHISWFNNLRRGITAYVKGLYRLKVGQSGPHEGELHMMFLIGDHFSYLLILNAFSM